MCWTHGVWFVAAPDALRRADALLGLGALASVLVLPEASGTSDTAPLAPALAELCSVKYTAETGMNRGRTMKKDTSNYVEMTKLVTPNVISRPLVRKTNALMRLGLLWETRP